MNFALLLSRMSLLTGKSQPMTFYEDRSIGQVSPRNDENSHALQDCKLPMSEKLCCPSHSNENLCGADEAAVRGRSRGMGFSFLNPSEPLPVARACYLEGGHK